MEFQNALCHNVGSRKKNEPNSQSVLSCLENVGFSIEKIKKCIDYLKRKQFVELEL